MKFFKKATNAAFNIFTVFVLFALVVAFLPIPPRFPAEYAKVLGTADNGVLYSIQPPPPEWMNYDKKKPKAPPVTPARGETLYRYPVLGKITLDEKEAASVALSLQKSIGDRERGWTILFTQQMKGCMGEFSPRHLLRIERDGHSYDFLICFQCGEIKLFRDGDAAGIDPIYTGGIVDFLGRDFKRETLDKLLTRAHIPLAE